MLWLDLVVIGRNEETNIERLATSIKKIEKLFYNKIFVDSASTDDSVKMARKYFEQVIELDKEEDLSAALGRSIGANFTESEWILFLDADMEITDQFCEWLLKFKNETSYFGFVGKYKDIDVGKNKIKYRVFKNKNGIAEYFGGAVILKRNALFKVGNWSANIYANEEIELYCRMKREGFRVQIIEEIMVNHYTEIPNVWEKVKNLLLVKNKKNLMGASQVFIKSIKEKYFINLFYLQPLPYILFAINFIFIILLLFNNLLALCWFILSHILFAVFQKGIKSVILAYVFQYLLVIGLILHMLDLVKLRIKA